MERRIKILDTTLRDGEQSPGCSMNIQEKLEIATQLEKLGVDTIEAGFAVSSQDDFEAVSAIAKAIAHCKVASLARAVKNDIDRAYEAVKEAVCPVIHVFLATSDLHLKHKLNISKEQAIEKIFESISYARTLCENVEFSAEDASRSDKEFLALAYSTAVKAGANMINVPDTVGYATPNEMYSLIKYLKEHVVGIENAEISVHCHNDLGMAVANSLAAILAGANQVECTINGIGERAGNAALEELVMALRTRRDSYNAICSVRTKHIYRTSRLLSTITGVAVSPSKAIVGENAFAHESGIHQHGVMKARATYEIMSPSDIGIPENKMILGKHSGKHAFSERLEVLGYDLSPQALDKAFERFKHIADRKKIVSDRDIEALLSSQKNQIVPVYQLVAFVVNAGSIISSTATIKLKRDEDFFEEVEKGSGPVDASFKAINKITGLEPNLDSYYIKAVTEGEDALGETTVKMTLGGNQVTGRGLSTDVIESSLRAYINGTNKLLALRS